MERRRRGENERDEGGDGFSWARNTGHRFHYTPSFTIQARKRVCKMKKRLLAFRAMDSEMRRLEEGGIRIEPLRAKAVPFSRWDLSSLLFLERYPPPPSPPSLSLNPHFDMHHISSYAHLSTSLSLHQQEEEETGGMGWWSNLAIGHDSIPKRIATHSRRRLRKHDYYVSLRCTPSMTTHSYPTSLSCPPFFVTVET